MMGELDPQEEADPAEPKGSQGNKRMTNGDVFQELGYPLLLQPNPSPQLNGYVRAVRSCPCSKYIGLGWVLTQVWQAVHFPSI